MAGLPQNPGILGRVVNALAGRLGSKDGAGNSGARIARLGLTQRQQELNHLWGVYRCLQYSARKLDWNGRENVDRLATDVIATQGYIPPGFIDAGSNKGALPLKFRKPTAPHALVKVIVDRFTGILFSEGQHPEVACEGDPLTEDWLRSVVEVTRLWQQMILARSYGGAMGSVAIGFQFIDGKPHIEVHDPRWLFPKFVEHGSTVLESIEKRYKYPKEELDPTTGRWEVNEYWYRRVLDATSDVLYAPALVGKGEEPEWVEAKRVDHGFEFCPVVWVQNIPVQDSEDGDPDCPPAAYDNVEAIDALIAQANRGIISQCDPTLVISTKAEMAEVKIGVDNAIRVPDGSATFLELQASGPKAAMEFAGQLREHVLEMCQCVLEHPDIAGKTATEVERNYQSMLGKADVMREQYGQRAVIPVLEMIWRAAQKVAQPRALSPVQRDAADRLGYQPQTLVDAVPPQRPGGVGSSGTAASGEQNDGMLEQPVGPTMVRGQVVLPPKYEKQPDGTVLKTERQMGTGGTITLKWPGYFAPTLQDTQLAVQAAVGAQQGGLVDDETAIGFVAPYFKVEDPQALMQKIRAAAAQQQTDMMTMMQTGQPAGGGEQPGGAFGGGEQDSEGGAGFPG
jgi:hypothetical protein